MRRGAIVLCGGKSTRMGHDKASLPFGNESMLARVVRIVSMAVPPENIVIVAAEGQTLPPLAFPVTIARDAHPERGPLEGLAAGLAAISGRVDVAFVTACDIPLLVPHFLGAMFSELGEHEIAVPKEGELLHPLSAVYRTCVLAAVRELLGRDQCRVSLLFEATGTKEVDVEVLRGVDPQLWSLKNLNRPEDYVEALRVAGITS